ncbi:MAG: hypothetical protein SGPRY_004733 [Prymnesium sp.]
MNETSSAWVSPPREQSQPSAHFDSFSFADVVLVLIFILPLTTFLLELLRRCVPKPDLLVEEERAEEMLHSYRRSERRVPFVDHRPMDLESSKQRYTDAQREKDRLEELEIKLRAAKKMDHKM